MTKTPLNLLGLFALFTPWATARDSSNDDLTRQFHQDNYRMILVGEQEQALVVRPSNRVISKGVAILVAEAGKGLNADSGLGALAPYLNDLGWTTLQTTTPNWLKPADGTATAPAESTPAEQATDGKIAEETEPKAETKEESPPSTADGTQQKSGAPIAPQAQLPVISDTVFTAQAQQIALQMQAVLNVAQEYKGFTLILAEGTSAAWLIESYNQNKLPAPDALVALGSFWPQRDYNQQVPELIAKSPMPVLDIFSIADNHWSQATRKSRKVAAQKALKLHYRQRELLGQQGNFQQNTQLSKLIYGWLSSMGW